MSYTVDDYFSWVEEVPSCELIHGGIYDMSPAPTIQHQQTVLRIAGQIDTYLFNKTCKVLIAPADVVLDRKTVVQPDVFIVCDPSKLDGKRCNGAPDFVVEVLSPSTMKKDLRDKFRLYRRTGVRELWFAYPNEGVIAKYMLHNKRYIEKGFFTSNDKI